MTHPDDIWLPNTAQPAARPTIISSDFDMAMPTLNQDLPPLEAGTQMDLFDSSFMFNLAEEPLHPTLNDTINQPFSDVLEAAPTISDIAKPISTPQETRDQVPVLETLYV